MTLHAMLLSCCFVLVCIFKKINLSLSKGGRSKPSNCVDFGLSNIQSFPELTQLDAADVIVGINEKVCTTSVEMRRWFTKFEGLESGNGYICISDHMYIQYDSYLIYDVIIYIYIHTGLTMRKHRGYVLFMDPNFRVEKNISLQLGISFMKAFTRETRFLLATSLVISRCGELSAI